jgi:hypothetical protein
MKPDKTTGIDWEANAEIISSIEPTSSQLDLFIREHSRKFNEILAEVDFDCFAIKGEPIPK